MSYSNVLTPGKVGPWTQLQCSSIGTLPGGKGRSRELKSPTDMFKGHSMEHSMLKGVLENSEGLGGQKEEAGKAMI